MPVLTDDEATRAIRHIEAENLAGQRTPIVGITARALESDGDTIFQAGMDDYMSKPISLEL